jgi:hypothetical protein
MTPQKKLLRCARPSSVLERAVLCRCQKRSYFKFGSAECHHLPEEKKSAVKIVDFYTIKWPGQILSGAVYASVPRTHALLTAGVGSTALREQPNDFLHTPMRPSKAAPPVGPEQSFACYLGITAQNVLN